MNIVIHQPHFLPWIGYFNKLANTDVFVVQDNVQYRHRYFQNRTRIRSNQADYLWLTIPIRASRNTSINEVTAVGKWRKILKTIKHTYGRSKYFSDYYLPIESIVIESDGNICDLNVKLLRFVSSLLNIDYQIRYVSEFVNSPPPPDGLAYICQEIGADNYIFGEGGGLTYHGTAVFHKRGIDIEQQRFRSKYESIANKHWPECTNLSVIDLLFHLGATETERIAKNTWQARKQKNLGNDKD